MYPPGQFGAWNRQPGRPRNQSDQPGQPPDRNTAERDQLGSRSDPGYSVLAVSDPAADVTSTQTWQAIEDGRATGTWTMPARPGAGPSGLPTSPAGAGYADDLAPRPGNDRAPASAPLPRRPPPGLERPGQPPVLPPGRGDAAAQGDARAAASARAAGTRAPSVAGTPGTADGGRSAGATAASAAAVADGAAGALGTAGAPRPGPRNGRASQPRPLRPRSQVRPSAFTGTSARVGLIPSP